MKLLFAEAAEHDLEAIGDYIARDHPTRALSFVEELREACRVLILFPRRFPSLPGNDGTDRRQRVYGRYLITYQVEDDRIVILRVTHSASEAHDTP